VQEYSFSQPFSYQANLVEMGGGGRGFVVPRGGASETRRFHQSYLREGGIETGINRYENIKPSGDPMPSRFEGDNLSRFGFQNVRGTDMNRGFQVPTEIDSFIKHGADVQGSAKTNKPWTLKNESEYDFTVNEVLGPCKTVYSSFPTDYCQRYQPGRYSPSGQSPSGRPASFDCQ
jgi:hypothetical protein